MDVSLSTWLVTCAALLVLIALDFITVSKNPHDVTLREAAIWSIFYIGVAVAFGVWIWVSNGSTFGGEYFAAYLVEKSLSVDNLFIFAIILAQFAVPSIYHQRILLFGVVLALILRGIFIAIGAAALAAFSFTFVLFGALLIWTGIGLVRHSNEEPDPTNNVVVRWAKRIMPLTEEYHGTKLFIRENGVRLATPMFLVLIAIGATDLLFALDSIPATFGVTQEPYLVFTANAFALLGLRALYFLLKGLLDRLTYLSIGLAIILIFIGIKLVLLYLHKSVNPSIPEIPTNLSLAVIAVILIGVVIASAVFPPKEAAAAAAGEAEAEAEPGSDSAK